MKLIKFRIQKYKCINDTDWIDVESLTAIVGKNEAGKTTILKALHKLNPFRTEPYIINEEWPRGERKSRVDSQIVCCAIFEVEGSSELEALLHNKIKPEKFNVTAKRNYKNELTLDLEEPWYLSISEEDDNKSKIKQLLIKQMPTFIYMSDYRDFKGSAQLDQLQQRVIRNQATEEDKTIQILLELSGLNLAEEVQKGNTAQREQRQYDLDDASKTLTNEIENRWRQRKYEIEFRTDGQEFYTFVKDEKSRDLLKLEERSKGFQWFFSFDLMFMYESKGTFKDCVILLDEPGLHLHPDGQRDLLERLKSYSRENCLIYSTHLPFMIDLNNPSAIRIVNETDDGTKVTDEFINTDPSSKFVLQAALGMSGSNSYLLSQKNLVVEGVDDYWILIELSNLLHRNDREGLREEIFITPAGGASEAVYISTFMIGQKLDVFTLFDADNAGAIAKEKLLKNWLLRYNNTSTSVMTLAEALEKKEDFAIEDLLTEKYYVENVKEVYKKQMHGEMKLIGKGLLCNRIERYFEDNVSTVKFNKGSVANLIKKKLINAKIEDVPKESAENAEKLFKLINSKL